jgi:hypothetical protein
MCQNRARVVARDESSDGAGRASRGRVSLLLGAALFGMAAAPVGWLVTDHLEQDNDFCNSCHLEADLPLHIAVRRDFDAPEPASLAGAHGRARVDGRAFRCIDCHGGHSLLGRARVKALAAADAFWYVLGRFEEPEGMAWPLWDEDCAKCHADFDQSETPDWQSPRFHQLPVHNAALGVGCVECHVSHETGGIADANFLHADRVRSQCARCHPEFEEDEG